MSASVKVAKELVNDTLIPPLQWVLNRIVVR